MLVREFYIAGTAIDAAPDWSTDDSFRRLFTTHVIGPPIAPHAQGALLTRTGDPPPRLAVAVVLKEPVRPLAVEDPQVIGMVVFRVTVGMMHPLTLAQAAAQLPLGKGPLFIAVLPHPGVPAGEVRGTASPRRLSGKGRVKPKETGRPGLRSYGSPLSALASGSCNALLGLSKLALVIGERIIAFLGPVRDSIVMGEPLEARWKPGGPWTADGRRNSE